MRKEGSESIINVALIGFGYAGRTFHAPLIMASRNLRLYAVVTSKSEKEVQSALGLDNLIVRSSLKDVGSAVKLVVVATPNKSHVTEAMSALELGMHVVVDKPFTCSLEEADSLLSRAAELNLVVSCFQNRQWDSDFMSTRRAILTALGNVVSYRSEWKRWRPQIKENWRWVADEPASGLLWDIGPHMVHQCLVLFGSPATVFCQTATQREGTTVDDYFLITLTFRSHPRLVCSLESGCLFHTGSFDERSFFVYGDKGSWEKRSGIDTQESMLRVGAKPRCAGWGLEKEADRGVLRLVGEDPKPQPHVLSDYTLYYEQVGDALLGIAEVPIPGQEARQVIQVIEAAVASSKCGRVVEIGYK